MYPVWNQLNMANSWMEFANSYAQLAAAAGEVIVRRSIRMSQGAMTGPEALGMVMEKATAFATAACSVAAATGADPARIATAALRPIHAKARSNVRKYRR